MNNILCENFDDQVEYIFYQLQGQDDVTVVCDREIAKEISNLYDEEDFSDYYSIEISTEDDIYIISKIKDKFFCIEYAYNEGKLLGFDEDDLTIVQKELFECNIKEYVEDFENVIVIGLEDDEENLEKECNGCSCEGCASGCCYNNEDNDLGEDIEEFLTEVLQDYYNDEIDIRNLLRLIYQTAYTDGENSTLINLRNSIDETLED